MGREIYGLGNRQWNIPGLHNLMESILIRGVAFEN